MEAFLLTGRQIKSELVARGISMASIARALGVSRVTVSIVVSQRGKSLRIQQAVARAVGRPLEDVFPHNPGIARRKKAA